ncbi:hypothetical protein [Streptomyces sp. URMC 124]
MRHRERVAEQRRRLPPGPRRRRLHLRGRPGGPAGR